MFRRVATRMPSGLTRPELGAQSLHELFRGHDVGILACHVEQVHGMRCLRAVVNGVLRDHDLEVECTSIHYGRTHATASGATCDHERIDVLSNKVACKRRSMEGAGLELWNLDVPGQGLNFSDEIVSSLRHVHHPWHLRFELTTVVLPFGRHIGIEHWRTQIPEHLKQLGDVRYGAPAVLTAACGHVIDGLLDRHRSVAHGTVLDVDDEQRRSQANTAGRAPAGLTIDGLLFFRNDAVPWTGELLVLSVIGLDLHRGRVVRDEPFIALTYSIRRPFLLNVLARCVDLFEFRAMEDAEHRKRTRLRLVRALNASGVVALQCRFDIVRRRLQTARKDVCILNGHVDAHAQVGRHRMAGVAHQSDPVLGPGVERVAHEQTPSEEVFRFDEEVQDVLVPAVEVLQRVGKLTALRPRLGLPVRAVHLRGKADELLAVALNRIGRHVRRRADPRGRQRLTVLWLELAHGSETAPCIRARVAGRCGAKE